MPSVSRQLSWDEDSTTKFAVAVTSRDVSAWEHWVVAIDTTQSAQADRAKVYHNGVAVETFATAVAFGASESLRVGTAAAQYIGRVSHTASSLFDGYIAEYAFVDGAQLDADRFGAFDVNGQWVPKDLSSNITWGMDGFWLDFADEADLGDDNGTEGNDWSLAAIASTNAVSDLPVDHAAVDFGNHAVLNGLSQAGSSAQFPRTLTDGGTHAKAPASAMQGTHGRNLVTMPFPNDALTYLEIGVGSNSVAQGAGICGAGTSHTFTTGFGGNDLGCYDSGSLTRIYRDGVQIGGSLSPRFDTVDTDRICIAYNGNDGKAWIGLSDGATRTWFDGSGGGRTSDEPGAGTNPTASLDVSLRWFAYGANYDQGSVRIFTAPSDWVHAAPSGAVPLITANLPSPVVMDPSNFFGIDTYAGTGAANERSPWSFQPDFLLIKERDGASDWALFDALRTSGARALRTSQTTAEDTDATAISSLDADGFTCGDNATATNATNRNTYNYVAYGLKANGGGGPNTDGTESSTVSKASHGGFAIVRHTNVAGDYSVGHGLGQTPQIIIQKGLGTQGWVVWHEALAGDGYLTLHGNAAEANPAGDPWADTPPDDAEITIAGTTWYGDAAVDIVTYAFARTPGLIGVGSYVGNGDADGPYVVIDDGASGFRPAFVLIKRIDSAADWYLFDAVINPANVCEQATYINTSAAEFTSSNKIDFTANGFKLRHGYSDSNAAGGTYIYPSFAEQPFGGAGVAQARAR